MSQLPPDVVFLDRDHEAVLRNELQINGWKELGFRGGSTIQLMFLEMKRCLPMDPPGGGNVHWDALSDSLWGGLDASQTPWTAIIWKDGDALLPVDPASFQTAFEVFNDVAASLRDQGLLGRTNARLRTFIIGKGPRFNQFDPSYILKNDGKDE